MTIVRPSHTYDTILPVAIGNGDWTIPKRMLEGKPVVVHDNGLALWTLTNSEDFSAALLQLISLDETIGEDFHITSQFVYDWNTIYRMTAEELGVGDLDLRYIASKDLLVQLPYFAPSVFYEKQWDGVYSDKKLKRFIPTWSAAIDLKVGLKSTIRKMKELGEPLRFDARLDEFMDRYSR
jgi:nucleoside-diphosphate-sugar epimerase